MPPAAGGDNPPRTPLMEEIFQVVLAVVDSLMAVGREAAVDT